jgi:hypothetical protein
MKLYKIVNVLALTALLAGCNQLNSPMQVDKPGKPADGNKTLAQVQVNIGGNARTILPDIGAGFSKFEISAEPDIGNEADPVSVEISGDSNWGYIGVPYGEWIITVTAFVKAGGNDYAAAKGSAPLSVYDDYQWVDISVTMPQPGGTGTFDYSVRYPAGGSATVKLQSWPLNSGTPVINNVTVSSGVKVSKNDVASGIYFLTVTATKGSRTVIRNEIVHIYDKLTSTADYAFTKLDFGDGDLQIGGTVNVLVNGEQPDYAQLWVDNGFTTDSTYLNFINSNGDAEWSISLNNLRGASTLRFGIEIYGFLSKEVNSSFPVPLDDDLNIDLGSVTYDFNPEPLAFETWVDGKLAYAEDDCYSITVTAGESYHFWGNDYYNGDGTKTTSIHIQAYYRSDGYLTLGGDATWDDPQSFTAVENGTVFIRVINNWDNTGTYAIAYSTNPRWHNNSFIPPDITIPLTIDTWTDGALDSSNTQNWYSITVTAGQTYYFWWNDSYSGDYTKTADIRVFTCYSYDNSIFSADSAWDYPMQFTANKNGTVYIRVSPDWGTGTYAIAYSTSGNRPSIDYGTIDLVGTWELEMTRGKLAAETGISESELIGMGIPSYMLFRMVFSATTYTLDVVNSSNETIAAFGSENGTYIVSGNTVTTTSSEGSISTYGVSGNNLIMAPFILNKK